MKREPITREPGDPREKIESFRVRSQVRGFCYPPTLDQIDTFKS